MKKFLVNSAVMLVSMLVGLLLVEGLVRLTAEPWLEQRMAELNPDSEKGSFGTDTSWPIEAIDGQILKFRASSEFSVSHLEYNMTAHIDELSARVTLPAPRAGARAVPALGDSFVFGIGVSDEHTITSRLSARYPDWRFLNLGFPGTAMNDQLVFLRHRHQEIGSPDRYLFFIYTGNDLLDLFRGVPGEAPPERKVKLVAQTKEAGSTRQFMSRVNAFVYHDPVLKRSYTIQLVRRYVLNTLNARVQEEGSAPIMHPTILFFDTNQVAMQQQAGELMVDQFRRLEALQQSLGFSSLVIVIPSALQLDAERRAGMIERYALRTQDVDFRSPNRIIETAAQGRDFRYFDTLDCMSAKGDPKELYYLQDDHLRDAGVRALTACIDPVVSEFLGSGQD
ncbi:MAG: SGNH/GDSL hydrolase family protein [Minwuia sp.]|nr:SGNH/GDSL hydrolase family protein [Minwuia sp.]